MYDDDYDDEDDDYDDDDDGCRRHQNQNGLFVQLANQNRLNVQQEGLA